MHSGSERPTGGEEVGHADRQSKPGGQRQQAGDGSEVTVWNDTDQ
jgi:hypothetical protein